MLIPRPPQPSRERRREFTDFEADILSAFFEARSSHNPPLDITRIPEEQFRRGKDGLIPILREVLPENYRTNEVDRLDYHRAMASLQGNAYFVRYELDGKYYYQVRIPVEISNEPEPIEQEFTLIHPAIDFMNGTAYVCQFLPVMTFRGIEDRPFIFSSNRERIALQMDILQNRGLRPTYIPNRIKNRWSGSAMREFLTNPVVNMPLDIVYEEVKKQLEYYFGWIDTRWYDFYALWILGTYFHQLFNTYPYVLLYGTKRSGKSKLLEVAKLTSFNGRSEINLTDASFFRLVQDNRCTLLVDENEYRLGDLGGLLSGYKKGSVIPRVVERKRKGVRSLEVEEYEIYSPKMFAGTKGVESIFEDRCVLFITHRSQSPIKAKRYPIETDPIWQSIRDMCYLALLTSWQQVRDSQQTLTEFILSAIINNSTISDGGVKSVQSGETAVVEGHTSNASDNTLLASVQVVQEEGNESVHIEPAVFHTTHTLHADIEHSTTNITEQQDTLIYDKIREEIDARELELWLPIFTMANCINVNLLEEMVSLALDNKRRKLMGEKMGDKDTMFYEFLIGYVTHKDDYIIADIRNAFENSIGTQTWLTNDWLGRIMRKLDLVLDEGRKGSKRTVLLDPDDIVTKAEIYGFTKAEIKTLRDEAEALKHTTQESLERILPRTLPHITLEDSESEIENDKNY